MDRQSADLAKHVPEKAAVSYTCTVICFFSSSKISSKKYSHEIIFRQTKLNENNFASHMWNALCAKEWLVKRRLPVVLDTTM